MSNEPDPGFAFFIGYAFGSFMTAAAAIIAALALWAVRGTCG